MYILKHKQPAKIEEIMFAELGMKESDIEEILRKNVDMLCDDEESMLIVGQQVRNAKQGRSDLTAIDNFGNLVLIEIKRDKKDIEARKEAFEFQAIRYAASCATIKSTDELVKNIYAPYVEKHMEEFAGDELTAYEHATRRIIDFLEKNNVTSSFNDMQRIILVASEFDEQTLSAVAWLNSNHVDISCFQLCLYKMIEGVVLDVKKVLPIPEYDDFYVNVVGKEVTINREKRNITRRKLPKIETLIEWGIVKEGDLLIAKGTEVESELCADGQVKTVNGKMSLQQWLKGIYNWSSVETYGFTVHKESGKTLSKLRSEYMEKQEVELL